MSELTRLIEQIDGSGILFLQYEDGQSTELGSEDQHAILAALRALSDHAEAGQPVKADAAEFEHTAPETIGTWQERCAALYLVIGCMADMFGIFETSDDVSDALDVAAGRGDVEKLLPWPKVDPRVGIQKRTRSARVQKVLEALNEHSTIRDISYATGIPVTPVRSALKGLVRDGLVTITQPDIGATPARYGAALPPSPKEK